MQTITFKQFQSLLPFLFDGEGDDLYSVLIRGRHGVGKSQVVYQTAAGLNLPVVEQRASQMTEGDLLGLPSPHMLKINGQDAASLRPFAWLVKACTEPVVLFLDEIDRATTEVRQGFFQLGDSRQINGWKLHPETRVIGAVNGGLHAAQYQVADMDPAELDRWVTYDIEPDVEDWLVWGKDNVHSIVLDFVRQNPQHLEHKGEFEPGVIYPTRRSWHRLSTRISDLLNDEDCDNIALMLVSTGFIGTETAIAFREFVVNYDRQVTPEEVFIDGNLEKARGLDLVEHCALIEKADVKEIFGEDSKVLPSTAFAYIDLAPAEAKLKFIQTITSNLDFFTKVRDEAINLNRLDDFMGPLQSLK